MQFTLTDEQRLIQSSALDWLGHNYDFRQRESSIHRDGGSPGAWAAFADMGWLGLLLAEDVGGLAAGLMEQGLLMQALGRHLVVEPFHSSVVLSARLLDLLGSDAQRQRWLPAAVAGEHRLALLHQEAGDDLPWERRACMARRQAHGWELNGTKHLAIGAVGAIRWLVSATGPSGEPLVFLVDPVRDGIRVDAYGTTDERQAADIHLDGVIVSEDDLLGTTSTDHGATLERVLAESIVAACWEAAGAMQAALEQTQLYTQQRKQFGLAIASFQVVQHRLAEMAVHCTEAQAACEFATMRLATTDADAASTRNIAAMVKNKVGRAARYVAQECVQLHGAMGVCEELPMASTFRRLTAFIHEGGHTDSHAHMLGHALAQSGHHAHSQTLGAH